MTSPAAVGASTLVTCAGERAPRPAGHLPQELDDGVVAWVDQEIVYAGPRDGWTGTIDQWFDGCTITPGFVDCHTHLPFVGWRDDEFEARLAGSSYRDLHGRGGIPRSAAMLGAASDEEVLAFCTPLLEEMLAHGTTAVELKTGYGLSVDAELRQARLARRLGERIPQTAAVTLLACHAVPEGMEREGWVDAVCTELIPRAAGEGLADAVDVYVEDIAFTTDDLRRVAAAAGEHGLPLRCHADQLGPSGAAETAVELGARSADHLNHLSPAGVGALGRGTTVAGLLPTSSFLLRASPPPVSELIRARACLALATDCNPGTSPVVSMPEAVAMACSSYGLAPLQALVAATVNPAWVLGLDDRLGVLEPGKRADLVVLDGPRFRTVPYRPGHNPVVEVICGGRAGAKAG